MKKEKGVNMFAENENGLEGHAEREPSMENGWTEEDASDAEESWLQPTKQERRWAALGALKAALMLGAVYVIGAAVLIWLLVTFWG